jgi:hypothetical protein
MGFKVHMKGLEKRLRVIEKTVPDEMDEARRESAKDLLERVRNRTPMAPLPGGGDLRDDLNVSHGPRESRVGFSPGKSSDYAWVQHEGGWVDFMGSEHPDTSKKIENYTTPGTGPKFLEGPMLENRARYKRNIAQAVKRGLKGR